MKQIHQVSMSDFGFIQPQIFADEHRSKEEG